MRPSRNSSTRTSSRRSTPASCPAHRTTSRRCTTSSWSTCPATTSSARPRTGPLSAGRRATSPTRSPTPCTRPTGTAWSTATSSRRTSWSRRRAGQAARLRAGPAHVRTRLTEPGTDARHDRLHGPGAGRRTPAPCDIRADIFGLGATLFWSLTGHDPVPASTATRRATCPPPDAAAAVVPRPTARTCRPSWTPSSAR